MGNRAVITTRKDLENDGIGVYLHIGGSRKDVEGLLKYCKEHRYRTPDQDDYGYARLCQVAGNWLGGNLNVGINRLDLLDLDNGDNGVYVIEDWEITERLYFDDEEEPASFEELEEEMFFIDAHMPLAERIWKAEESFFSNREYVQKCQNKLKWR